MRKHRYSNKMLDELSAISIIYPYLLNQVHGFYMLVLGYILIVIFIMPE